METKTIAEQLTELKASLETLTKTEIKTAVDGIETQIKAIELKADKTELEKLNTALAEIKAAVAKNQEFIDAKVIESKRFKDSGETKPFNQILAETIEANADKIRNFRPNGGELRFDMLPKEKKSADNEVKTVGDMSLSNNFPGASTMYQDVRGPIIPSVYERTWIADLLPQGTSTGTQVIYPKETGPAAGSEGGVAAWTDYSTNKAQVDWDFTAQSAAFTWLAGWAVVQRDMIDDIPWMTSYLQSRLLISLKTAENDFVLNGSGAIPGLQDVASPYNGSYTGAVDRIIDAAYGQIPAATADFYSPTHVIVNTRDIVRLGLNKASGSGEYDLPDGSVAFVNGRLTIGGLQVVGTTSATYDTFYALDNRATMFIRRIQPELRMFEDATLAKKNQIMFRIEERATLVVFNNAAIIKGVLVNS